MRIKVFAIVITLCLLTSGILIVAEDESRRGIEVVGKGSEEIRSRNTQEIHDWHELDAIRNDLNGSYELANDLDPNTDGYKEKVSENTREEDTIEMNAWREIGYNMTWEEGNGFDVHYPAEYILDTTIEDKEGNTYDHTYDSEEGTIILDEDTEKTFVYVIYDLDDFLIGWNPIGDFHIGEHVDFGGIFDGNGYKISGLYIDRPLTKSVGLFGYIGDRGEVSNLEVVDIDIRGDYYVGGLAGRNHGTVSNSYVTGAVNGVHAVGGLVGRNHGGTVSGSNAKVDVSGGSHGSIGGMVGSNYNGAVVNSYATGDVNGLSNRIGGLVGNNPGGSTISNSFAAGDVSGPGGRVGGLVGLNNEGSTVFDSYSTGDVIDSSRGLENFGGLLGENQGVVKNSYSTGSVTTESAYRKDLPRGLVGLNEEGGVVSDSYWDVDASGISSSDGGTGLTTDEMTGEDAPDNMDGFDFDETWDTVESGEENTVRDGYPVLQEIDREEQLEYVYLDDIVGIVIVISIFFVLLLVIIVTLRKRKKG